MEASFFPSTPSPLYSAPSPFPFSSSSSSSSASSSSSSSHPNNQSPVSDTPPFEPMLTPTYPHPQTDIYYATEQDGVYSYQPLFPSSAGAWQPEQKKEKLLHDDHYYHHSANGVQHPVDIHPYTNTNYSVKHADVSYIQNNTPLIIPSPQPVQSPITHNIDVAVSPYGEPKLDDWEQSAASVRNSIHQHSFSHSHSGAISATHPQVQYSTPRVKQEDLTIYTSLNYYVAPQPQHVPSLQSCAFDFQSIHSGSSNSDYTSSDGSGPSSHHGTPNLLHSRPLPNVHPYPHSSAMGYAYETLPQDCYMHSAELSPSELSASLSPQAEYQVCDPRFVSGSQDAVCCTIERARVLDDEPEQLVYNIDCDKMIQLEEHPSDVNQNHPFPELQPDFDVKPNIDMDADADADADAEGEDDPFDQEYQDDGEPEVDKDTDDDYKDGEYVFRPRRASSSSSSTALRTPPHHERRKLRSRSASSPTATRFSPYQYCPPQTSTYGRTPRGRRLTTGSAGTSVSMSMPGGETGSFGSDQQTQQASVQPTTTRRRTRPATPLPIPIPVPNLTKKSRGRGVPTVASLEMSGRGRHIFSEDDYAESGKRRSGARSYTCKVPGCGKCFARGEHLKRHVRSIHTYEKPHKCPYPGCGKDFSRHDNLGQHMRVHKDYVPPPKDSRAFRA